MEEKELYLHFQTYNSSLYGIFSNVPDKISHNYFFIKEDCYFFLNHNNIRMLKDQSQCKDGDESIFNVKVQNNNFKVNNPILKELDKPTTNSINIIKNKIYYVINRDHEENNEKKEQYYKENDDYYLNENDIIKLGSTIYIVRKININNDNSNNNKEKEKERVYKIENINKSIGPLFSTYTDPILLNKSNFCEHIYNNLKNENSDEYNNIKKWLNDRIQTPHTKKVKTYGINLKVCEDEKCILNNIYPLRYKLPEKDKIIELIDIQKPINKNYIILESLEELVDSNRTEKKIDKIMKYIHIIEFKEENERIIIGRKNGNDINISHDQSISRTHAVLIYKNGRIIIKNKSISTNTLVLIKTGCNCYLEISDKKEIFLQAGRALIEAKVITKKEHEELEKLSKIVISKNEEKEKENKEKEKEDLKSEKKQKIADEFYDGFDKELNN